jgi:amino acid adenylation domain-containing protein
MEWVPITEWLSRTTRMVSAKTAIEWGSRSATYHELERESDRIADVLFTQDGWKEESIVGILSASPFRLLSSIVGTLKAGGAFAPIDPLSPSKRIAAMLEKISPDCLLVDPERRELAVSLSKRLASKPRVFCGEEDQQLERAVATQKLFTKIEPNPEALCYLYFTSGSSGSPKAIAGRLKAIDHFVRWEIETFDVGPDSRVSQLAHAAFDAYLKDVFVPLCAGGTVCAPEDRNMVWQPDAFADWLDATRITHLHCVPSMFRSLLAANLNSDRFPDLRYVLLAGEPLLPSDADTWMTIFGERIRLVNLYGPSETTLIKLFHIVNESDRHARSVPIGRAMPGAAALVVDDSLAPCEPGILGEIWIRTPFRSRGYLNDIELTNEVFVPNPFTGDADDIIYKTRDYGRIREDGELEFLGRADGQVKIRGARIELNEIEDCLRRCHAVQDAAVIVTGDEREKSLRAFLVLGAGETTESVVRHASEWLPPYFIPSDFTVLESLPKTATGKVDRKTLTAMANKVREKSLRAEPLTALQEEISKIWVDVLKVSHVLSVDNFFHIGGHSLAILQVLTRLRQKFDIEMSIADMFVAPTLESFSRKVEQAMENNRSAYESEGHSEDQIAALQRDAGTNASEAGGWRESILPK